MLTSEFQPASATPAADLYTIITDIMVAAGWVFVETATAAQAGNTGDASENVDVNVWRNAASTVFVLIAVNESGTAPARLRFRCSEQYNTGTHKVLYPCPGIRANTAFTPAANDAVDAAELTIWQTLSTTSKVGWVDIPVSAGGFNYVAGANADEVVLATGASFPNWVHAGRLAGVNTGLSPATSLVFLGGCAVVSTFCVSWEMSSGGGVGDYRVSREPNQGANSLTGAFCYSTAGPSSVAMSVQAGAGGQFGFAHQWLKSFAGYSAYLHHASTNTAAASIRTHLGKLGSMALFGHDSVGVIQPTVKCGDTVTIDGDLHIVLNMNHMASTTSSAHQTQVLCARENAF